MHTVSNAAIKTDVLVVGAGPVGLALHLELQRRGLSCLHIDKHETGLGSSRAAVIHAHTLEALEALGVVPELLGHGLKVSDFRVRDRERVLLQVGFAELPSAYPFALMCPQNRTEEILTRRLHAGGLRIERPATLVSMRTHEDGVRAAIALPDGTTREVQAAWIVGCDGVHSTVRDAAGIAFEGADYAETFVLADVKMDWPLPRDEVSLFFSAQGLVVVAPLPEDDGASGDRYRVVATVAEAADAPSAAQVAAILEARGPRRAGAHIKKLVWSSAFHLQHRVAAQLCKGRVLLCGDAAHAHSPAGGQGMNTGIQDAISLGAPLARALREGDQAALEGWATRRQAMARDVVRMTDAMTRAATLASPLGRSVRNTALQLIGHFPYVQEKIAARLAQLDLR